jgi:hypothetical protein
MCRAKEVVKTLLAFRQHVNDREARDEQPIEIKHPLLQ